MKVSVNPVQTMAQGAENQHRKSLGELGEDFQGMLLQMMAMMTMTGDESQLPGSELLNEGSFKMESIPFMENPSLIKMNTGDVPKELTNLIQQMEGMDLEGQGISKEVVDLIKEGNLEEALQQLTAFEESTQSSKLLEKSSSSDLQKILKELEVIGNSTKESQQPLHEETRNTDVEKEQPLEMKTSRQASFDFQQENRDYQQQNSNAMSKKGLYQETTREVDKKHMDKIEAKDNSSIHGEKYLSSPLESSGKFQQIQQQGKVQNMQEVVSQMIEKVQSLKEGEKSLLQVKLKPEELGNIEIKLEMKAGELVGKIFVENLSAKGALDTQLQQLKNQLSNQNISVQEIEVSLQQHGQEQNQERRQDFFYREKGSSKEIGQSTGTLEEVDALHPPKAMVINPYYTRGGNANLNLLA